MKASKIRRRRIAQSGVVAGSVGKRGRGFIRSKAMGAGVTDG
jgi:hypothetical protein